MYDRIMFDENWYDLMETTAGFNLVPGELDPQHCAKAKIHSINLLPMLDHDGILITSICGMASLAFAWLFIIYEKAIQNSKKQKAGSVVMKPMPSVTKAKIEKMLITIYAQRWPKGTVHFLMILQSDNCKCHPDAMTAAMEEAAKKFGLKLIIQHQCSRMWKAFFQLHVPSLTCDNFWH